MKIRIEEQKIFFQKQQAQNIVICDNVLGGIAVS